MNQLRLNLLYQNPKDILAAKKYGDTEPSGAYMRAKEKDNSKVSAYGEKAPAEDFAEAVRVYVETDGGTKNPAKLEKFRNRFQEIDSLMKVPIERRAEIVKIWKENLAKRRIQTATTSAGLMVINGNQAYVQEPPN